MVSSALCLRETRQQRPSLRQPPVWIQRAFLHGPCWVSASLEVIHLRWQCCILFNNFFEYFCMWYFLGTGLFYDAVNNEIGAEMAYLEANKLNQAAAVAEAKALREEERLARGEHESEDKGQAQGHRVSQISHSENLLFSSNIKFIMYIWKLYQHWCFVTLTISFMRKRRGHVPVFYDKKYLCKKKKKNPWFFASLH